ncbi:Esterase/lipase/thioesterase family protein [Flavobacterium saliperosum S13]|nr:proline iminopeptidase-family hydrolase [Flavobacterium saliperosum]ESU24686.1 Esterase/lipase/thioesterase family protein [Flavobacterium saliperosum S13]
MKKTTLHIMTVLFLSLALFSCKNKEPDIKSDLKEYFKKSEVALQTGGIQIIPIETPKGTFKVWTKRFGNNPKIKVLLLNGGPGATHEYFECFESFLPEEGIEFIYYDQLGCGNSDDPKDVSMWDLPRYVEEVEQVRKALHLDKDNFYLLGHSWGGILAMEYALKYQNNMKGLIISNMMADAIAYGKYADEVLAKQMNPEVLRELRAIEAKSDFSNPRYMELLMPNFYEKHILRFPAKDWPEPVTRSLGKTNQSLYVTMQGPSEFGISGKLEKWNRMPDLKNITIPTLVIGARYDTMDPKHMEEMSKLVKKGTYLFCPKGAHMAFYDDQEIYFKGLISFLKK